MSRDGLKRQLNIKGYRVKKGVIQDTSFIEVDLEKKRYSQEKLDGKQLVVAMQTIRKSDGKTIKNR